MIEILRTDTGEIKAVAEYYVVNSNGNFKNKGEYIWISEVEIAPQFRGNGILKTFAKNIMLREPQALFGYFWRYKKYSEGKHPDRKHIRIYHKFRWLRLINER